MSLPINDLDDTAAPTADAFVQPLRSDGEFGNYGAFAARRSDGSVVSWGNGATGGQEGISVAADVQEVFSSAYAFAALKADGSVQTWGSSFAGGDSSSVQSELVNVESIFSTKYAFAALTSDGAVVTWGHHAAGGDSNSVPAGALDSDVVELFSNQGAFAALKEDGTVVTWGDSSYGGNSESVQSQLTDVQHIVATGFDDYEGVSGAFTALKADGTVVTWGDSSNNAGDSTLVRSLLVDVEALASPVDDVFNDAPALTGTPVQLPNGAEDVAYLLNASDLLQGYSDANGDTLSITSVSTASANGTITNNGDGTWTYLPATDLNGDVSFSFVVSDGNGGTANGSTSLTLDPVEDGDNTPPAAPSTPDLTPASDSGSSDTDNLTNDSTPTFTGHSIRGSTAVGPTRTNSAESMASSVSGASSGATRRFATNAYNGMAPKWSNCSGSVQSKAATGMDNAAARPWQRSGNHA